MAKKFYVVWQGRETGIFTDWNTCKQQVDGFAGAKYKSFKTQAEAEAAFAGTTAPAASASTNSPAKKTASKQTVKTYTANQIAAMPLHTKIFTDGGCDPNPGKAGSGIAVYRDNTLDERLIQSHWH